MQRAKSEEIHMSLHPLIVYFIEMLTRDLHSVTYPFYQDTSRRLYGDWHVMVTPPLICCASVQLYASLGQLE
jgi:hypothetical protein